MKPLVFLIGKNDNYLKKIEACICNNTRIMIISKSNLMAAIYKEMPHCIVIIEDDMDGDGFLLVDSTISLEYIPTICVTFEKESWQVERYMKHATYLNEKDMDISLPVLVEQAIHFTTKYHAVHVCLDTYDIMNEEIKDNIEKLLESEDIDKIGVLKHYLALTYVENYFLDNSPEAIWLIRRHSKNDFIAYLLPVTGVVNYNKVKFADIDFNLEPFMETGFYINDKTSELSDIDSASQFIPSALLDLAGDINNAACFAMHDMMMIALNYNDKIRQSDLNILKALTINIDLMMTIKDKMEDVETSFIYTMDALARAAEGNDDMTGHHIKRVNYYSRMIAMALGMEASFIKQIVIAAQMHDVGKIFVPESILNKAGKLTDEEYELIKQHTVQGAVIIGESKELSMASKIARYHHEKFDGTGYPEGLVGEAIPIEARIVCLADIYDALRSERPYKKGFTHEEAYNIIVNGDGRVEPHHFDPEVLNVFKERHLVFDEVFKTYNDV